MRDQDSRGLLGVAIGAALVALVVAFRRQLLGVDLTDESIYAALPYSFVLGQRPFVEERALYQGAALILAPAVKAYLALVGSNHGLVLFLRGLYLLSGVVTGGVAAALVRRWVGLPLAIVLGALLATFQPLHVMGFGYYGVAFHFLTLGTLLAWAATWSARGWQALAASVVCFTLATLAYPALAPAAAIGVLLPLLGRAYLARGLLLGGLFPAGLGLAVLAWAGWENLRQVLEFQLLIQEMGGGRAKLMFLLALLAPAWRAGLALPILVFLLWRPQRWTPVLVPVLLVWACGPYEFTFWRPYVLPLYFLGPLVGLAGWLKTREHLVLWVPLAVAWSVLSWASSNAVYAASIAAVPALVIGLALFGKEPEARSSVAAFALTVLGLQLFTFSSHVYRDEPPAALVERVATGPYAGLWTTPGKVAFLEQLGIDLAAARSAVGEEHPTGISLDNFPAGYLVGQFRSLGPAVQVPSRLFYRYPREPWVDYVQRLDELPRVALVIKRHYVSDSMVYDYTPLPSDPLVEIFRSPPYRTIVSGPDYDVMVR